VFLNIIEIHGSYDPITEYSANTYPSVENIKLLENDDYTVAEILINGKKLVIAQSNKIFNKETKHMTKGINWTGPFTVLYDNKFLK
jgi:hypothetical protein